MSLLQVISARALACIERAVAYKAGVRVVLGDRVRLLAIAEDFRQQALLGHLRVRSQRRAGGQVRRLPGPRRRAR